MKNLNLFFVVSLIFITVNVYSKNSITLTDDGLINSITVSQTNLQTIKGWGVTVNALTNSTAKQAELVDLGITIARIYMDHTESNADGTVVTSAMDGICNQINIVSSYKLSYILSSWCPNYAMKDNNAMSGAGKLRTDKEGVFTDYWKNVCTYILSKGLPLPKAISIQNEPTLGTSTYDGMGFLGQTDWDYSQFYRVVKSLRSKLDAAGYTNVGLLGPEEGSYCTGKNWGNALAFLGGGGFSAFNDATLKNAIWGCSAHSYNWGGGTSGIASWRDGCEKWGKDKWMTEFSDVETVNKNVPTYTFAIESTRRFCSDMAFVRNNYWFWWSASQGTYPEVLLDGTYYWKLPIYYILQKIWKNVPVGSVVRRITSTDSDLVTSDAINMDAVAFLTPENKTVLVLVNFTTSSISQSVDGLTGDIADIYQSTSTQNMILTDSPAVSSGVISSVTLPAKSVTVIVTNNISALESINKEKNRLSVFVAENEALINMGNVTGKVTIYNMQGQIIKNLGYLSSNSQATWNKRDDAGNQLPIGIYFCKQNNQSDACKFFLK